MSIYQKESEGKGRGVREEGDTEEEEEEKNKKAGIPRPIKPKKNGFYYHDSY